jgi:predicted enzyme related to lactoylglutathione lyase
VPIDVRRERVDAEVARLIEAGATVLRVHAEPGVDHYGVTMADPEGNEFCVH